MDPRTDVRLPHPNEFDRPTAGEKIVAILEEMGRRFGQHDERRAMQIQVMANERDAIVAKALAAQRTAEENLEIAKQLIGKHSYELTAQSQRYAAIVHRLGGKLATLKTKLRAAQRKVRK